jgi:hypothetical protein
MRITVSVAVHPRIGACALWGMANARGRFNSETAVWRLQKLNRRLSKSCDTNTKPLNLLRRPARRQKNKNSFQAGTGDGRGHEHALLQ